MGSRPKFCCLLGLLVGAILLIVKARKKSKQLTPGCLAKLPDAWDQYAALVHKKSSYEAQEAEYVYRTDVLIYIDTKETLLEFGYGQVDVLFCLRTNKHLETGCGVFEPLEEEK